MDFLNFVTAVHHRLGIDIPEIDYPKLVTLDGAIAYIEARLERARRKAAQIERTLSAKGHFNPFRSIDLMQTMPIKLIAIRASSVTAVPRTC